MNTNLVDIGALVCSREGAYFVARWRANDGREGDVLGSVHMSMVDEHPEVRDLFTAFMREVVLIRARDGFGANAEWGAEQIRRSTR